MRPRGNAAHARHAGNARDAVAWGLSGPVADAWAWGSPGLTSIARIGAHQVKPHRWAVSPTKCYPKCSGPGVRASTAGLSPLSTPDSILICYRQWTTPRVFCTTHTYLSQFKRSSGHPHRFITTQTIRSFAGPCADTCSAHHGLYRSSGFTPLFVRVWDVSPLRFAPALRNDAIRADCAPAPPRLAPCGHASNHGPRNDAGPDAL
jgi:hypothetical protein